VSSQRRQRFLARVAQPDSHIRWTHPSVKACLLYHLFCSIMAAEIVLAVGWPC